MRIVIIVVFITLASFAFGATGEEKKGEAKVETFEIIVIDAETEDPIPAAQVKINQKELKAYTNFDGVVEIKDLQTGSYDIEVSFISYEKQQLKAFQLDHANHQVVVKLHP